MLDNTLEIPGNGGWSCTLCSDDPLIPEPWANNDTISQAKRDFTSSYATMMEPPWDGPASILFSQTGDGWSCPGQKRSPSIQILYITSDGYMILSSEVGVLPIRKKIVLKERLHPGKNASCRYCKGKSN